MDSYFLQKINKALAEGIFAKKMLNAKTAELSLADSTIKYQDTTINVLTRENLKVKTDIYFEKATIAAKIIENNKKTPVEEYCIRKYSYNCRVHGNKIKTIITDHCK
jgi:hypothetical protein